MNTARHSLELFRFCPRCGSEEFRVNNIKSKNCRKCGFTYYLNPSAAVAGFIVDADGNFLVGVRGNEPARGSWDLPGGFVDYNETAEEAFLREIEEETGLLLNCIQYLFSIPNDYLYSDIHIPTLDMFFFARTDNFNGLQAHDDVSELIVTKLEEMTPDKFGLDSIRRAVEKFRTDYSDFVSDN